MLQPLFAARSGLAARSSHPSLSPRRCLQGAFPAALGPAASQGRMLRPKPEACPASLPTALPACSAQAIRDIHKELKQKSVQCDRKMFKIRCTTAELHLHIHMLEKIGHSLCFKFSFMALLYSKIVQRSEEDFFKTASGLMMRDWEKNQDLNFCPYTSWTQRQSCGT